MSERREYIIEIIAQIVPGTQSERVQSAEMIVERLQEEGVLHLGYGNAEVDTIIEKFVDTFGTTKTSKYDRFAAQRLANKYGAQSITGIIALLGTLRDQRFAPVLNNIGELEAKMPSVLNFLRKVKGSEEIDV